MRLVLALGVLPVLTLAIWDVQAAAGNLLKGGLTRLGMNDSAVERVFAVPVRDPAPFVVDLTDDNWEHVLRTGEENPLSTTVLPDDTVWVISVFGPDAVSKMMLNASDSVALYNSSDAGGSLPTKMKFARLDYGKETVLPTLLWLWKVPILVIATKGFTELRFFKIGHVAPFHHQMASLLSQEEVWITMSPWEGALAPGGSLRPYLTKLGQLWAAYHTNISKVPSFVILILSGALMNLLIGVFHREKKPAAVKPVVPVARPAPVVVAPPVKEFDPRANERAAFKAKLLATDPARAAKMGLRSGDKKRD